ncbi:uncharacterized protein MELLADRAFT_91156 [Melampsora larici-populina 98AG31]|uniref:Uncharacterized protein n=1 Tax=Melampsora larici-populina (strain 98AG31 / pathotype 3-4-7) TaxID=747676 RepID=F4RY07_MELLP|nr:uncharacterized protein MELLADRAFT_91156 [Melampsora larici-populina 98AG31]EGG02726.1 hypothetical protein MELLADRAFT_91156 [Melampsora larici-populina 98AG31]
MLVHLDKSASQVLSTQLCSNCQIKGHLSTYRLCDEVCGEQIGPVKRVKIVACKGNAEATAPPA